MAHPEMLEEAEVLAAPQDGRRVAPREPSGKMVLSSPAQTAWARLRIADRLRVLRGARVHLAVSTEQLARAIAPGLQRGHADTLAAEVLPLLAAIRFLEREAATILKTRRLGAAGRPAWLGRVTSQVERVPFGRVLVIGPGNYPLLLPGVQTMQALAAGNAVIWKPGRGGKAVAALVAAALREAGLPDGLLTVTDESVAAVDDAIAAGVGKIVFTGSAAAGREVLHRAAERVIPCVVELSGADAVIVLPSADVARTVRAIGFGLRLNGSATCMAPRRILLVDATAERSAEFVSVLTQELRAIAPVSLPEAQRRLVTELLHEAKQEGATIVGGTVDRMGRFTPALVLGGRATMRVAQTDVFAPVLTVLPVHGSEGVVAAQQLCPLALTASIFGSEREARELATRLQVGHISINDLVVPTADPRVPFVGRGQSGFGATRGAEGLLEMTVPRVVAIQRGRNSRRYDVTGETHVRLFAGLAALLYGGSVLVRARGLTRLMEAGRAVARAERLKKSGEA